jgi:large subunit ribosomal protein L1
MAISKNRKASLENVDLNKLYNLDEASQIVKDNSKVKFDATVDLAVRLGVDPKQANQMVRGVVSLPHGTGKSLKVLALVSADKEVEAKELRLLETYRYHVAMKQLLLPSDLPV